MVGFGSSLRMARRSGWEGGYLDYETLKLLLSQIEAVYEEEGHRQQRPAFVGGDEEPSSRKNIKSLRRRQRGQQAGRDYRDELFLESDSDEAYCSVDDDQEEERLSNEDYLGEQQQQQQAKPFSLTYSQEITTSDDDEDSRMESGCGVGVSETLSTWTSSWESSKKKKSRNGASQKKPKKKTRHVVASSLGDDEDEFFVKARNNSGVQDAFFLATSNGADTTSPDNTTQDPSFFNAPVRRTFADESSALLPPATPVAPYSSSLMSIRGSETATPPHPTGFMQPSNEPDGNNPSSTPASPPPRLPNVNTKKLEEERKRERRLRRLRRRRLRKLREARERKVPRHLRLAHSKARAITERFLGLLRAETEKVMLFAQSRLGELADTAGSLRFPSFEDEFGSVVPSQSDQMRGTETYEYPLSDGGMHPSASSSENEGNFGGQGMFPWSDSSDEDEKSGTSQIGSPPLASTYSSGALSEDNIGGRKRFTLHGGTPTGGTRKPPAQLKKTQTSEAVKAVRRQIAHFSEIRETRPVFQRTEYILGEDMLFLSAVEEADGYTSVGVELMHTLRFIYVNLIAVRKICRKHDRLLMNRMLGGYYHRTKLRGHYSRIEDAETLGGLVARASGDIYEAHPALIGQMNHYKLVGLYDKKIQKLANSRTVQVVSSCLALALSEYEVARTRADALTKLHSRSTLNLTPKRSGSSKAPPAFPTDDNVMMPALESEDEGLEGPPSTASSISLTRLRFTVTSIFALREAARFKTNHYGTYLSRYSLVFTGQPVAGEGLDGCSRETLDFIVSYNPDSALLLDTSILFEGLQRGRWMRASLRDVMISTLATSTVPYDIDSSAAISVLTQEEKIVANAVSVIPESKDVLKRLLKGTLFKELPPPHSLAVAELPPVVLRLNRISCFLFMMNYFIGHSTTNSFVKATGAASAFSAAIIGVPNLSAILVLILHCWFMSREYLFHRFPHGSIGLLRNLFVLSSLFGVLGNTVQGIGVIRNSIPLTVVGRFLFGFSSAEILHRQLLGVCLPSHLVAESALLVQYRVAGIICGLLVGSAMEMLPITINTVGVRSIQATSWLMTFSWLIHLIRLCVQFRPQFESPAVDSDAPTTGDKQKEGDEHHVHAEVESDASESDEEIGTPCSMLYRSSSDVTSDNPLKTYGAAGENDELPGNEAEPLIGQTASLDSTGKKRTGAWRHVKTFANRIRKLLAYHICIPIGFAILFYASFALEVFFTATPIITSRYFDWSGARAGIFLGSLAFLILPTNFVCERIARKYEERTVMKKSLLIIGIGLFIMVNWISIISLATRVPKLLTDTEGRLSHPYDWKLGVFQYVIGLTVAFVGLTALDGANLSLLSKISPQRLKSVVINVGTLSTFVSLTARLLANVQIGTIDLSHKLINTDIVNALVIPLLLVIFVIRYFIKKHFFFLM